MILRQIYNIKIAANLPYVCQDTYQTQNAPLAAIILATSHTPPSTLVCKTSPLKD